jgi:hypothetical protein
MKVTQELAIIIFNIGLTISVIPFTIFILKGSEFLIGFAFIGLFLGYYLLDEERTRQRKLFSTSGGKGNQT